MRDDSEAPRKKLTRRRFLSTAGSSAAAAALIGRATAAGATERGSPGAVADAPGIEGAVPITLRINGKEHQLPSTRGRRCSIASARPSLSPERRRAATTGNAAPARCT